MQGEELVEGTRPNQIIVGHGKLGAHDEREHAGKEHEAKGGQHIPDADAIIVAVGPAQEDPPGRRPHRAQPFFLRRAERRVILIVEAHFSPSR